MMTPSASCTDTSLPMWRRFRRRTMAPRRPMLFPEQYGLALVTLLAIVLGIVAVVIALPPRQAIQGGIPTSGGRASSLRAPPLTDQSIWSCKSFVRSFRSRGRFHPDRRAEGAARDGARLRGERDASCRLGVRQGRDLARGHPQAGLGARHHEQPH